MTAGVPGRALAVGVALSLGLAAPSAAQEPPAEVPPPPAEVPPPPAAGAMDGPGRDVDFAELGLADLALRGTDGRAEVFVPRPAGAPTEGWQLQLRYRRSPLLHPISTLTVLAGGTPLQAVRLDGPEVDTLVVDVPPGLVGATGTTFTLAGYLRLRTDGCEERDNPGQYVTVEDGSRVVVPGGGEIDLSEVPLVLAGPFDPVVDIVAEGDAAPAADRAAWQIGRWHAERGGTPRIGSDDPDSRWELVVDADTTEAQIAVAGGELPTVTLTAPSAAALSEAITALDDDDVVAALGGARSALRPRDDRDAVEPIWADGVARFDELGVDERRLVGPGARTVFVSVDRPLDVRLTGTRLDLVLDASGALTDSSIVQATVNGTAVGSRRLQPGVATYRFDVPAEVADRDDDGVPRRTLDLGLDVVLDLPQGDCQSPDTEAARVTVLGTSAFSVEQAPMDLRELGRFPAPFDDRPLVVHDDDDDGRAAALQIAAAYGRWSPDAPAPSTASLGDVDDEDLRGRDLVLLGDTVADDLGVRQPTEGPVARPEDGVDAVLAALASPVDGEHDALVVRGEGDGVLAAVEALADRGLLADLHGRVAAVTGERVEVVVPVPVDELAEDVDTVPAATGDDTEDAGPQPDEDSWVIPSMVLLATLLLVGLVVIRYRWLPVRR